MTLLQTTSRPMFVSLLALGALTLVGCGGDSGPVTSANSKYEVDEEPGSGGSSEATSGSPAVSSSPDTPATPGSVPTSPGAAPVQPPSQPPKVASGPASDKPADLMAYVAQLERQEPTGTSREEVIADFQRNQDKILGICDRVFAMEVPAEIKLAAARSKVTSLSQMSQLGNAAATTALDEFVVTLNASPDKELKELGFQLGFANKMDALSEGKDVDPATVIADLNHLIATQAKDARLLQMGNQVAGILEQSGHSPQAIEAFRLLAAAFKDAEDERVREAASGLVERARLLESDITTMLSSMLEGNDEAIPTLVTASQELLRAEGAGLVTLDFFQQVLPTLEIAKPEVARELYTAIGAAFKANANEDLAKMATEISDRYQTRSSLIGKPFTVEGSDLAGEVFDWSKFKGKVVLVDFWATWCQPCLEEMPNIRENYDRYKDQGFEVVGVNLDEDMQSLQRFMSFQKLPWPSVLSADPAARGWKNPMVDKCGLTSIPFLVLVGKDGNVLATNVRGDALDQKLAELFPAAGANPAQPTTPAPTTPAPTTPAPATPKTPAPEAAPKKPAPEATPAAPPTTPPAAPAAAPTTPKPAAN